MRPAGGVWEVEVRSNAVGGPAFTDVTGRGGWPWPLQGGLEQWLESVHAALGVTMRALTRWWGSSEP